MSSSRPSHRSIAAIAAAAAVFAVAGSAIATGGEPLREAARSLPGLANGSVTGPKLAANAVTTRAIANGAVTFRKIAPGTITADRLAPGVVGGLSAAKIMVVTSPAVSVPPGSRGTQAIATCPAGQRAAAGGYNSGFFGFADATGPTSDGGGWFVTVSTGNESASITATAVCVAP